MNITIHDRAVLSALGVSQIAAYLRARGWRPLGRYFDSGTIWTSGDEQDRVVVPRVAELEDYAEGIADILAALARIENRPQGQILRDIDAANKDIVRIRIAGNDVEDGALPLDGAAHLLGHARDLVMAAACSTVRPRPIHTGRKPSEAVEYLKHIRMGQTEQGSFVLTLQSEVPPQLGSTQPELFPELPEGFVDPFERRVTRTLAQALQETQSALQETQETGAMDGFLQRTELGVSANLCDALAGMTLAGTDSAVTVQFSWSPTRLVPANTPRRVAFSPDNLPILREVARVLRERATFESFELSGPVIKLHRPEGATTGQITIAGVVDGYARRVTVELWGQDYERAIDAHLREATLYVEGELRREAGGYRLMNPRSLSILQNP